jgi:hypothetical protein
VCVNGRQSTRQRTTHSLHNKLPVDDRYQVVTARNMRILYNYSDLRDYIVL